MQLPKLVDASKVRSEVQRVLARGRHSKRPQAPPLPGGEAKPAGDEHLGVLLSWCQAVCSSHGLSVLNFRTSFADARGLCLLVSAPCYGCTAYPNGQQQGMALLSAPYSLQKILTTIH